MFIYLQYLLWLSPNKTTLNINGLIYIIYKTIKYYKIVYCKAVYSTLKSHFMPKGKSDRAGAWQHIPKFHKNRASFDDYLIAPVNKQSQ